MSLCLEKRSKSESGHDEVLEKIIASLRGLQFGSVNVTVQDGMVIQIERIEKTRIGKNRRSVPNTSS